METYLIMKVLFLTTYQVAIQYEHYFTRNVWKYLVKHQEQSEQEDELVLGTVLTDATGECYQERDEHDGHAYYKLHLKSGLSREESVRHIAEMLALIAPVVIHSNMIEGYDVEAAARLGIPICLTIHIGGFVCPRGGGSGFLKYDDSICNQAVSKRCARCVCCNLPAPAVSYGLFKLFPNWLGDYIYSHLHRNLFYLTPFLMARQSVLDRIRCIQLYKKAVIIAANKKLAGLLALNGLTENVRLIPHGVEERPRLLFPPIGGKVKLFFLGRIQYSKGLHVLLKALEDIDNSKYELHVIGDAEPARREQRYYRKVLKMAQGKSVVFHGRLPNDKIDAVISDMHVMVFPTICLEVYGISVAESLSIGRPVLATRCGGAEMQVEDGVNGWLVEPNRAQELRGKIQQLLDNPALVAAAAGNARLPHPITDYVNKLWTLYKELSNK